VCVSAGARTDVWRTGGAAGFRLDGLRRVADTKSNDHHTTLLHWLVEDLDAHHPDLAGFAADLQTRAAMPSTCPSRAATTIPRRGRSCTA